MPSSGPGATRSRIRSARPSACRLRIAFGKGADSRARQARRPPQPVVVARDRAARRHARAPSGPTGGCPCRSRRCAIRAPLIRAFPSCSARRARWVERDRGPQRPRERLEQRPRSHGARSCPLDGEMERQLRVAPRARERTPRSARGRSCRSRPAAARPRTRTGRGRRCRSRTRPAPRPSAPWPARSGRCRRGRRAPGRAPGRCRSRRPRPCGGRRCEGRRAPHGQIEAAVAGEQVEHVVEEPDAGVALAGAVAVERQADADVGLPVVRSISAVRAIVRPLSRMRASIDSRVELEPSARAIGAAARASSPAPSRSGPR